MIFDSKNGDEMERFNQIPTDEIISQIRETPIQFSERRLDFIPGMLKQAFYLSDSEGGAHTGTGCDSAYQPVYKGNGGRDAADAASGGKGGTVSEDPAGCGDPLLH